MSRSPWTTITALVVVDSVLFAVTIHAHVEFHRTRNGPAVMSVGQLLGWIASVTVLLIIVLLIRAARLAALARRRASRLPHAEPPAPRPIGRPRDGRSGRQLDS